MVDTPCGNLNMDMIGKKNKAEHEHYMQVLIKHDRERTCWNDRLAYWENHKKTMFWKNRQ